jgi:hypothetical protein
MFTKTPCQKRYTKQIDSSSDVSFPSFLFLFYRVFGYFPARGERGRGGEGSKSLKKHFTKNAGRKLFLRRGWVAQGATWAWVDPRLREERSGLHARNSLGSEQQPLQPLGLVGTWALLPRIISGIRTPSVQALQIS